MRRGEQRRGGGLLNATSSYSINAAPASTQGHTRSKRKHNRHSTMDDEFDDAEIRFDEALGQARKKLAAGKKKAVQKCLADAERQLKRMEAEARHSDGVERKRLLDRIRKSKSRLTSLKQEYQQIQAGGASPSRRSNELYGADSRSRQGNTSFNAMSDSNKQRARILENSATQNETSDLLADSHRIANETREIGTAALNSIEDQTDMLIEAKDSVDRAHRETKRAGQLLNTMSRRVCTNKAFLFFIVILLIGANVLVIFLNRATAKKPEPSPSPPPSPPPPAPSPLSTGSFQDTTRRLENMLTLGADGATNSAKTTKAMKASVRLEGRFIANDLQEEDGNHHAGKLGVPRHTVSAIKLSPVRKLPVPHSADQQDSSSIGVPRATQSDSIVTSKAIQNKRKGGFVMEKHAFLPAASKISTSQASTTTADAANGWHLRGNMNKTL